MGAFSVRLDHLLSYLENTQLDSKFGECQWDWPPDESSSVGHSYIGPNGFPNGTSMGFQMALWLSLPTL